MNKKGTLLISLVVLILTSTIGIAGDFDWIKDFNLKAEADTSGLKARLETRFKIGGVEVDTVLSTADKPADAYMLLRLGEISNQPIDRVIRTYKAGKGQGWGRLAKSLGIKPGSKEFHALKQGQDLYGAENNSGDDGNRKEKDGGHGKGKGKGKK